MSIRSPGVSRLELVGLPGSGKTTYALEQLKLCENICYIGPMKRSGRIFYGLLFCIIQPRIVYILISIILREYKYTRHPGLKHKFLFLFLGACAKEFVVLKNKNNTIIDEGLCQFVFSVYERKITELEIKKDFNFLIAYKQDYNILFFETEREVRNRRYKKRGRKFRTFPDNKAYSNQFSDIVEANNTPIKNFFIKNFSKIGIVS